MALPFIKLVGDGVSTVTTQVEPEAENHTQTVSEKSETENVSQNYANAFSPSVAEKSVFPSGRAEFIQSAARNPIYLPPVDQYAGLKSTVFYGVLAFAFYKIFKGVVK